MNHESESLGHAAAKLALLTECEALFFGAL